MEKNSEIEVSILLKPTKGEPSHAWVRLWRRLLSNRKVTPPANREDASDGKCKDGNQREVPDF